MGESRGTENLLKQSNICVQGAVRSAVLLELSGNVLGNKVREMPIDWI